ncbi:MAG: GNAT family N-acetyltransferase [Pleurocapsa sp. MO_192.B19]|nr:GNAT family N-acetyltransferase [Pleurocapsa sp. MO_192.B19]
MSSSQAIIVQALPTMDNVIAEHFYRLWLDNNVSEDVIDDYWLEVTLDFIQQARKEQKFQAFIAQVDNEIVGSASCQLFAGLYPSPFKQEHRKYGYIWNIYVESEYRRRGIATKLTNTAINYLKTLNCTKALLHASPLGKQVYENLGFIPSNEMIFNLT